MTSKHYGNERPTREKLINEIIGQGNPVAEFYWDKGHKNGPERHIITDTGIIIVYNWYTNKLVTKLIARPGQIERYYKDAPAPAWLMNIARRNQRLGYNFM